MFVSGLGVAGLIMCEWFRFDVGIALLLVSAVMLHWLCTVYAPPPP